MTTTRIRFAHAPAGADASCACCSPRAAASPEADRRLWDTAAHGGDTTLVEESVVYRADIYDLSRVQPAGVHV